MIGISNTALRQWIRNYQSLGIEVLNTKNKNSSYPAELKEKAVKDYLAGYCSQSDICKKYGLRSKSMFQKNNYDETAQKYQVSYQQVYTWTNKYKSGGVEALQDKRGKRKNENEMSEQEKLRVQNKLLEAENRRKQMEIDFLKKLNEVERGQY